jgi:hypothetical protein
MSVGAWVGETAVGRARAAARGDESGEAGGGSGPSSWRELVAALVALRAEAAAVRRVPVVKFGPAVPGGELLDDQAAHDHPGGADRDGVVGVLRRIDSVTAAAVEAASSGARSSLRADGAGSGRS